MASKTIKGLTVEIGGDTTKLGKALQDVEAKSRSLSKELGDVNKMLKFDPGNAELLAQKQKILANAVDACAEKLDKLKQAEKQVQEQFEKGEVSEEQVRALKREIVATENKMKGYQKAIEATAKAADQMGDETEDAGEEVKDTGKESKKAAKNVDDFADAAEKAEKSSGNLGSTLAGAVKTGLATIGTLAGAAVTGLTAAAEGSREYRTEIGKLNAAYEAQGRSTAAAEKAYEKLYSIIGETDQSVEAAQQIALLSNNSRNVAKWAGLASGVVGQFGDALQPETFFESANETLKLGEATGAYVQMLEGCGLSVEEFNAGLAACTTETEKQNYMLKVTEGALGKAGEAYEKNNADIIAANKATNAWMQSLAGIGAAVELIITDIKLMGASLLSDLVPGVQQFATAFKSVLGGEDGAAADLGAALSNIITGLLTKVTEMAPTLMQVGLSLVTTLVTSIIQQLPQLLTTAAQLVSQLITGIGACLPQLLTTGGQVLQQILTGIATGLPSLLQTILATGSEILMNLVTGIANSLPSLVSQALDALMQFAQTLYDNAPSLIETGFDMLSKLVAGIINCLPELIAKGPEIISKFANVINDNFPTILKKGAELLWQIIKGLVSAIPDLIANIGDIIRAIVDVWQAFNWLQIGKQAITWLKNGITGMIGAVKGAGKNVLEAITNVIKNLPQNLLNFGKNAVKNLGDAVKGGLGNAKTAATTIFNGIVNVIKGMPSKLLSIGKDIVTGLWNGISDKTGWIVDKIGGFVDSVVSRMKKFFGIASPSKVMRDEVGKWLPEGMAVGIEKNAESATGALEGMAKDAMDAANAELANGLNVPTVNGIALERSLQQRSAQQAAAVASTSSADIFTRLDKILTAIERGQVLTIDGKKLVGGTAAQYDASLGQRRALVARGAI